MTKNKISNDIRKLCYERDDETCQFPGCTLSRKNGDNINLHHIKQEQSGGKETPDNLITLCDIHHKGMHMEFSAFYPDSQGILYKMNSVTKNTLSKIRKTLGVDDGNDLIPYLIYLTGNKKFRPGQLKTIRTAISGKNVLFVSPTGSGKSVCYQLPGLLAEDPTLVISPLKTLMKDQVQSIWSKKIPTTYINSDLTFSEKKKRYDFIHKKLYKFIFVAPERFDSKDPQTNYLYNQYSHLVIDEAHEIETWGMAFRPSYRRLGALHGQLGKPPIIALTATASKHTQELILESLNVKDAEIIVTGFFRDNIKIKIHKVGELNSDGYRLIGKYKYIKDVIVNNPSQKILIFVLTVKEGEALLQFLHDNNIDSKFYHSKLEAKEKMNVQNRFSDIEDPKLEVLISTSAFGMGIDISDIRHVIHLSPALSLTDYTQQIGRAGRDGYQSYAHLLYHENDKSLLRFMSSRPLSMTGFKEKHKYSDEDVLNVKNKLDQQIDEMVDFIKNSNGKEWQYILNYFGESKPSFWDRNGKNIVDGLIIITILVIIYIFVELIF